MRKTGRFLCGIVAVLGLVFAAFPAQAAPKRVVKIEISGMIDRGLAPYIERVLRENAQADAIILEINTLGGLVDSAMQIRDALLNTNVPTIAFINKRAISAGALISFAATHIVMSPGASIGARCRPPDRTRPGSRPARTACRRARPARAGTRIRRCRWFHAGRCASVPVP